VNRGNVMVQGLAGLVLDEFMESTWSFDKRFTNMNNCCNVVKDINGVLQNAIRLWSYMRLL